MSIEAWIGLAAVLLTGLIALLAHVRNDERRHTDVEGRLKRVEKDIGDHETGLRGAVHKQSRFSSRLAGAMHFIASKLKLEVAKDLEDEK